MAPSAPSPATFPLPPEDPQKAALRRAGIVLAACDRDLRYTAVSAPLPGLTAADTLGRRNEDLLPGPEAEALTACQRAALDTGEPAAVEVELACGGEPRIYAVRAEPIRDALGVTGLTLTATDVTALRRAERAATDLGDRVRVLLAVMREGVILHDGVRILEVNAALCRMLGYGREELIGRSPLSFLDPEALAFVTAQAAAGAQGPDEVSLLRADGTPLRVEVRVERVAHEGRVLRATLLRELQASTESEAALRESEARYKALAAATREGIIIHDGGRIVEVNDAFCALHGTTREIAIGRPAFDFIAPEVREAALVAIRSGTVAPYETLARRLDGTTFPIEASGRPTMYQGRPMRVATIRDLSERRLAEAALRESEERFRGFAERSQDVLWIADATGRLEYVSPAYETVWGEPRDAVMQSLRRWMERLHPEDRDRVQAAYAATLEGERLEVEYRILRPDGEVRWVRDTGFPILDGEGRIHRAAGLVRDITQQKRTEEHQKLLLGELNHRVKNTLATVQSIARQTLRYAPSAEVFQERFEDRVLALSQTHNLLTEENWHHGTLAALLKQELAPHGKGRYRLEGAADVRLAPRAVVALGMALHELATNAAKHGALSRESGRVDVAWQIDAAPGGPRLTLTWQESGGPAVAPVPARQGFGSRLLQRGIAAELGGSVAIELAPDGLNARIEVPLDAANLPAGPFAPEP